MPLLLADAGPQWAAFLGDAGLPATTTDSGWCERFMIDPIGGFVKPKYALPPDFETIYAPLMEASRTCGYEAFVREVDRFDLRGSAFCDMPQTATHEDQAILIRNRIGQMSISECGAVFMVMTHLSQKYVFGRGPECDLTLITHARLPVALAAPWKASADRIGSQPTLSYEAYVLRNTRILNREIELPTVDDLEPYFSPSGLSVEIGFIKVHQSVEMRGGCLPLLALCLPMWLKEASTKEDRTRILRAALRFIEPRVAAMTKAFEVMFRVCSPPKVYYDQVRPYLFGSEGLPDGLYAEGVNETWRYSGGSGAQSPLIQLLDTMLADPSYPLPKHAKDYLTKNRLMMSDANRALLARPEIRHLRNAVEDADDPECTALFNTALSHMAVHRKTHKNLVHMYVQEQLPAGKKLEVAGVRVPVPVAPLLEAIRAWSVRSVLSQQKEPYQVSELPIDERDGHRISGLIVVGAFALVATVSWMRSQTLGRKS